jgi:hypothetical protein
MDYSISKFNKVCGIIGSMEKMSMVLVVQYNSETLCSDEGLMSWFQHQNATVNDDTISINDLEIQWNNMKRVNSLIFTVDVVEDADFPPILFNYVASLKNNETIISIAEESDSGYQLIFESNLDRFKKEILTDE